MDLIQLHRLSSGIPSQALAWAIDPSLKRNNETLLSICLSTACWRTRLINFGIGSITMVCRQDMLRVLLLNISNCCVQMVQDNCLFFKSTSFKSWRSWVTNIGNGSILMVRRCLQLIVWANLRKNTFLVDQLKAMIKFGLEMLIVDTGILLCGPILN